MREISCRRPSLRFVLTLALTTALAGYAQEVRKACAQDEGSVTTPARRAAERARAAARKGAATEPGGVVEAEAIAFDAGRVQQGVTITHAFVLRNKGKHDLSIHARPG